MPCERCAREESNESRVCAGHRSKARGKRGSRTAIGRVQNLHQQYKRSGGRLPLLEYLQSKAHITAMLDPLLRWAVRHLSRDHRCQESVTGLLTHYRAVGHSVQGDVFRRRLSALLEMQSVHGSFAVQAGSFVRGQVFLGVAVRGERIVK